MTRKFAASRACFRCSKGHRTFGLSLCPSPRRLRPGGSRVTLEEAKLHGIFLVKSPRLSKFVLLVTAFISCPVLAALPVSVEGEPLPSLAPVLERVTPSVVNVYTETRVQVRSPLLDDPFFRRFFNVPERARERISRSLGSYSVI